MLFYSVKIVLELTDHVRSLKELIFQVILEDFYYYLIIVINIVTMKHTFRVLYGLKLFNRFIQRHACTLQKLPSCVKHPILVPSHLFKKSFSIRSINPETEPTLESKCLVKAVNDVEDSKEDFDVPYYKEQSEKIESLSSKLLKKYNLGRCEVDSFPPTFNFAAYVNDSPSLQELVKLGVNLYRWERRKGIMKFILQRDFFQDMSPHIKFLHNVGVPADNLGMFLTDNPLIFKEDLDDLNVRINYLESKNFSKEMITHIVTTNPFWLMFSTKRIDRRLGHFQKTFKLRGSEVRYLATKQASLITYNMHHIKTNTFVLKEELGLSDEELKYLLMNKPRIWMISQVRLKNRFEYAHMDMKIPHELIVKNPSVLTSREFRIKERHLFLKSLKRDQYDPKLEGYVSLNSLVSGTNSEFAVHVAKTSVDTFNMFLKTL